MDHAQLYATIMQLDAGLFILLFVESRFFAHWGKFGYLVALFMFANLAGSFYCAYLGLSDGDSGFKLRMASNGMFYAIGAFLVLTLISIWRDSQKSKQTGTIDNE